MERCNADKSETALLSLADGQQMQKDMAVSHHAFFQPGPYSHLQPKILPESHGLPCPPGRLPLTFVLFLFILRMERSRDSPGRLIRVFKVSRLRLSF